MSELFPAVQAVINAAVEAGGGYGRATPVLHARLAAALRAAADQIENLYCDGDVEDSPGIVFALRQLMLIANELETQ
jgi:hypothetical protein